MNLVEPKVEEIKFTQYGKKIEKAGRVCYKSDSNISDTSYVKFIQNIVKSGHTSVLEHERITFKLDLKTGINPFCSINQKDHMKYFNISKDPNEDGVIYISANIRGWYESLEDEGGKVPNNGIYTGLKNAYPFIFTKEAKDTYTTVEYKNKFNPDEGTELVEAKLVQTAELISDINQIPTDIRDEHDSRTFEIVCSRACSHQLVRHRSLSFSQQSQRYCNFSIDKFGHSVDFIMPKFEGNLKVDKEIPEEAIKGTYKEYFEQSEDVYFSLIDAGLKPEDARAVLPNAAATTIVITGTTNDWKKFIALRDDSHAQGEIREIAKQIRQKLNV